QKQSLFLMVLFLSTNRQSMQQQWIQWIKHAYYNEKVCNFLNSESSFHDWIVTIAFYTSMYYVMYKFFPCNYDGRSFNNPEALVNHLRGFQKRRTSKHMAILTVIRTQNIDISGAFEEIYSLCHNARYTKFEMSVEEKEKAVEFMNEIKDYCHTNKPGFTISDYF
ncbi:MAG: hypothetical protein AAFV80_13625, partial [Bacteroidota bacterium]